ncbi:EscU/YscU/HrcU family type III secretion system export apparatus switch protein [bacterium]|nr:EscU/YscU/HrcU family type III secretion system export apparatus switch protein [bacterium]
MSESQDRTLPATPRRREDARNRGLAPNGAVLAWPAMAAVVLVAMPVWCRTTASATVAAIENIHMTGKGGSSYILLPIVFPTVVVVILALGVLLLVRTIFDGAAWRLDRLAFRFERIDPKVGLQRIVSTVTAVRAVSSFIGLAILASAAWLLVGPLVVVLGDFLAHPYADEGQGSELLSPAVNYLWGILLIAGVVAAADWWLQRFRFERKIRMTPSELREELRGLRSDPKVRWQRNGK